MDKEPRVFRNGTEAEAITGISVSLASELIILRPKLSKFDQTGSAFSPYHGVEHMVPISVTGRAQAKPASPAQNHNVATFVREAVPDIGIPLALGVAAAALVNRLRFRRFVRKEIKSLRSGMSEFERNASSSER